MSRYGGVNWSINHLDPKHGTLVDLDSPPTPSTLPPTLDTPQYRSTMSYTSFDKTDELAINTIRVLAAETVAKANSGHPGKPKVPCCLIGHLLVSLYPDNANSPHFLGAPMGLAPAAHVLFTRSAHPLSSIFYLLVHFLLHCAHL